MWAVGGCQPTAWHAIIVRSGQVCREAARKLSETSETCEAVDHRAPSGAYAARA